MTTYPSTHFVATHMSHAGHASSQRGNLASFVEAGQELANDSKYEDEGTSKSCSRSETNADADKDEVHSKMVEVRFLRFQGEQGLLNLIWSSGSNANSAPVKTEREIEIFPTRLRWCGRHACMVSRKEL
jgi:hypothetical protein